DATFAVEAFTPADPATALFTADGANPIVIRRESHIFNANTRVGPWDGLTVTAGLQNEWTHEEGFGRGLQEPDPHVYASQKNTALLQEDFGLRYTEIPFTVVYADTRFQQEWIDHYERDAFSPEGADFLRDTDDRSNLY